MYLCLFVCYKVSRIRAKEPHKDNKKTENGKRKAENFLIFSISAWSGKRNAAIKPRAEGACTLCRGGAAKSLQSRVKTENFFGNLSFYDYG